MILGISTARLIRHIKTTGIVSYKELSELYYPKGHELHGSPESGEALCVEAAKLLGLDTSLFNPKSKADYDKNWGWQRWV